MSARFYGTMALPIVLCTLALIVFLGIACAHGSCACSCSGGEEEGEEEEHGESDREEEAEEVEENVTRDPQTEEQQRDFHHARRGSLAQTLVDLQNNCQLDTRMDSEATTENELEDGQTGRSTEKCATTMGAVTALRSVNTWRAAVLHAGRASVVILFFLCELDTQSRLIFPAARMNRTETHAFASPPSLLTDVSLCRSIFLVFDTYQIDVWYNGELLRVLRSDMTLSTSDPAYGPMLALASVFACVCKFQSEKASEEFGETYENTLTTHA